MSSQYPVPTLPRGFTPDPGQLADFVMRLTDALGGSGPLHEALAAFAEPAQARVVHLWRLCLDSGRRRTIATLDLDAARGARPLVRELGAQLLPDDPREIRPGTLWTLDELEPSRLDALDARGRMWMRDRGFGDAGAIPLGRSEGALDLLEFHTTDVLGAGRRARCELLAALGAEVWSRRPQGCIETRLRAVPSMAERQKPAAAADPLSPANPWGLTAAELRICALIRDGIDPTGLVARTGSSVPTVRSHLRSIYAKARVPGQVGLIRALLADAPRTRSAERLLEFPQRARRG
jgi:DNA-binding CsgD family transcriptional regulator